MLTGIPDGSLPDTLASIVKASYLEKLEVRRRRKRGRRRNVVIHNAHKILIYFMQLNYNHLKQGLRVQSL